MKLLINTASAMKGGSVQVACSFVRECAKLHGHSFGLILGPGLHRFHDEFKTFKNFQIYCVDKRPAQAPLRAFYGDVFNAIEDSFEPNVVFTTSGPAYWRTRAPHLIGYNLPHYIYPESPYFKRISLVESLKLFVWREMIKYFYSRDADAVVVQTDDVNLRVRKLFKCNNVTTVSNACGSHFLGGGAGREVYFKREHGVRYFLYLTAYYPHKNIEIINRIIDLLDLELSAKVVFILTLPDEKFDEVIDFDHRKNVINVGPIDPLDCPSLYKQVDFAFVPSLLECFSASYVEAMAMEVPIFTSNLGFATSVCGDAACYFDPMDPMSIIDSFRTLLNDEKGQDEIILAGRRRLEKFSSASRRASEYISICESMISV